MSGYIGPAPVPQAVMSKEVFTATASQTTFSTKGYQPGFIQVFRNGTLLWNEDEYTATNGSDVVLSDASTVNDEVTIWIWNPFEAALFNTLESDVDCNGNKFTDFESTGINDQATSNAITITADEEILMPSQPRVIVDFGGPSAYTAISQGTMPFDNVINQTGSNYNTSTYKWTCPADGWYRAGIRALSDDTPSSQEVYEIKLYRNSTVYGRYFTQDRNLIESTIVYCSENDTLHWHMHTDGTEIYMGTGDNLRYSHASFELLG